MSLSLFLEDFGTAPIDEAAAINELDVEKEKLHSFEKGYAAGWEDASQAHGAHLEALSAHVQKALMDLDATRVDAARAHSLAAEKMLSTLLDTITPTVLKNTLPGHILSLMTTAVEQSSTQSIIVHVPPNDVEEIRKFLADASEIPHQVIAEASLQSGQACLGLGDTEEQIDLAGLLTEINAALAEFFHMIKEDSTHDGPS
jgi:flagellar biosynthesis/type III secretory pathway protein FliH